MKWKTSIIEEGEKKERIYIYIYSDDVEKLPREWILKFIKAWNFFSLGIMSCSVSLY